jgi:transposase InsO family protein
VLSAADLVDDDQEGPQRAREDPGPAVHDDLVLRVFSAPAPDLVWVTDITEHPTLEGKLYCCSIKDVFSNRIVGYAFGPRMTAQLAARALRSAIARRRPAGTVVVHPSNTRPTSTNDSGMKSSPADSTQPRAPQSSNKLGRLTATRPEPPDNGQPNCEPADFDAPTPPPNAPRRTLRRLTAHPNAFPAPKG